MRSGHVTQSRHSLLSLPFLLVSMEDDFPPLTQSNPTSKNPPPITPPKAVGGVNLPSFDEWEVKLIGQSSFPAPKKIPLTEYTENIWDTTKGGFQTRSIMTNSGRCIGRDLHETVYQRMSRGCFRGNLDANRVLVVDHCKVEIPDAADNEKHYAQGYIELMFWWFGKRGGLLDAVQFLELLKFERIRDLNQFRQLTYHYLWMSSKERLFLPLMFQLYLNYNEDSLMHILQASWRQAYNEYVVLHRPAINLPSAVGPKEEFKALLAAGQGGFHHIDVAGNAYPNTGVGELELVRNMVVHILKYLRKHHNGKIPDHAMDYVEEFITTRFPAIYKSIFGFLLHWDISMDILDRWASKGNFKFFDKAKENSVQIAAWK